MCQEIRKRFSTVSIPIIMVSAKSNPEHIMKGLEAGSVDYVKKPFHRQELLSRVRAQVRNRCGGSVSGGVGDAAWVKLGKHQVGSNGR